MIKIEFENIERLKQVQEYAKKLVRDETKQFTSYAELKITHVNQFRITATDGFTLISREFDIEKHIDGIHVNKTFYISLDSIKELKLIVFKSRYNELEISDDMMILKTVESGKMKRSLIEFSEEEFFPDYKNIIPEKPDYIGHVNVSFKRLESIAKSLDTDIVSIPIQIKYNGCNAELITNAPILLDGDTDNCSIIMPIRKGVNYE